MAARLQTNHRRGGPLATLNYRGACHEIKTPAG